MRIAKTLQGDRVESVQETAGQIKRSNRIGARSARLLVKASLLALGSSILAQPALAQSDADGDQVADTAPVEAEEALRDGDGQIIVSGSRIQTSGFTAPTPLTAVGEEQLEANAQPNIFTTVAQLPSLQGSSGTTTNTFSTSSGQQGLSSFALRGLGLIRTLTLIDNQRVVGAYYTGVADVSLFPQLLIKRVDVVNGGASASYGSDAIGGAVNFITDTRFEGIKGHVQGGISTYSDNEQGLFQIAGGTKFMDDRLHVVGSVEWAKEEGVGPGGFGLDMPGGRDWWVQRTQINRNVTNDGMPQYVIRDYAQPYNYTRYGVISSGPLQGIAFDASGNPFNFNYGSGGVPARNASGTVTGCFPGFCLGGDLSGNVDTGRTLQSAIERETAYGRVGFDFAPNNEIYVSYNIGRVRTHNQPVNGQQRPNQTIQCANPYVPDSIQDLCTQNGITQFGYGTSGYILPNTRVDTDRRQYRIVAGLKGEFNVLGTDWSYDHYYQRGINRANIDVSDISLSPRFSRAINAIELNGVIVCADPVARANGCQPINILSGAAPSAAALAYVQPENGPFQRLRMTQDVASLNFSGAPFDLWAGPVSVAFGAEYRKEFYTVRADPYGAGVSDISPNSEEYPADPALNATVGSNWYAGNYKNGNGEFDVKEAYLELDVPIFDGSIGRASLNGAARLTDYSTYGRNWTWKIGGTWDTPLEGLRLRAVTSKDFRAPNLSELFAAPVTTTLPNFLDPVRNVNVVAIQSVVGNPNLRPETARSTIVGAAFSGSSLLPGFGLSFDYYTIKVTDIVGQLGAGQIVDFCFRNIIPETCSAYNLNNQSGPNFINVQPFNFGYIKTRGFDVEASYRWDEPLGLPGDLMFRGLATHIIEFTSFTGLPGAVEVDSAGVNAGATPHWKLLGIQTYSNDRFSLTLQERWVSDGTYNPSNWIECQSGCPVSTPTAPTIDNNQMAGAFYLDIGASFNVTDAIELYGKVDNVFDRDPTQSPFHVNPALYDIVGRMYRAGVRFRF
jgi:iron complex outermembrane receptor protein